MKRLRLLAVAGAAGMLLAALPSQAGERTVELTIRHSRFSTSVIDVSPGTTVRFVVRNLDPIDHELIVGPPSVQEAHEEGRERQHHGDVPGEISVPAGTTAETTYTFRATGTIPFACHAPGHLAYGMSGTVRVG